LLGLKPNAEFHSNNSRNVTVGVSINEVNNQMYTPHVRIKPIISKNMGPNFSMHSFQLQDSEQRNIQRQISMTSFSNTLDNDVKDIDRSGIGLLDIEEDVSLNSSPGRRRRPQSERHRLQRSHSRHRRHRSAGHRRNYSHSRRHRSRDRHDNRPNRRRDGRS
jgi:hypothetical protein